MSVTDIISMPKQDRWLFDITYDFGDEFRSDLDAHFQSNSVSTRNFRVRKSDKTEKVDQTCRERGLPN